VRDVWIGTIGAVIGVVMVSLLTPRPQPVPPPPVGPLPDNVYGQSQLGWVYSPATRPTETRLKLERLVGRFTFERARLDQVMAAFADATGVNVVVRWRALEASGIPADMPVSIDLHDVPARVILELLMYDVGHGNNVVLDYRATDNVLTLSTIENLSADTVTWVHDVRDFVEDAMKEDALGPDDGQALSRAEVIESLVRLIQETVDPPGWRDSGGSVGGIRILNGLLIVSGPEHWQEQIAALLNELRRTLRVKR
jgi:hypothetical protein